MCLTKMRILKNINKNISCHGSLSYKMQKVQTSVVEVHIQKFDHFFITKLKKKDHLFTIYKFKV